MDGPGLDTPALSPRLGRKRSSLTKWLAASESSDRGQDGSLPLVARGPGIHAMSSDSGLPGGDSNPDSNGASQPCQGYAAGSATLGPDHPNSKPATLESEVGERSGPVPGQIVVPLACH